MRKLGAILFLVTICLAAAVSPVWTQDKDDEQDFVTGLVERLLSSDRTAVNVEGLGITLSGNVAAERIELHDRSGAWLTLEEVTLDWNPFSLLETTVQINEVKAKRITFMRLPLQLPNTEAPEEAEQVVGAVVKRLAIDELLIGDAVMGHAFKLAAEGSMEITQDPRVVTINLAAKHADETPGRLDAAISYQGSNNHLSLDITLVEEQGGVVSALLPLDEDAEIELRVIGDGKLDDWNGRLSFAVGDATVVDGRAQIKADGEDFVLGLDIAGAFDALTPDGLDEVFAGHSEISLAVRYAAGKPIGVERAELKSDSIAISAKGAVDPEGEATDLQLEAKTVAAGPVSVSLNEISNSPLIFDEVSILANLKGKLEHPDWSVEVRSRSISTSDVALRNLHIDANGTGFAQSPDVASEFDIVARGSIDPLRPDAIPPLFAGEFAAEVGLRTSTKEIEITKGRLVASTYALSAQGNYGFEDESFDLKVDLKADSPKTGTELIDRLLDGPVSLAGRVSGRSLNVMVFDNLSFSSAAAQARINGAYRTDGHSDLTAQITVPRLELLHDAAKGALVVDADLEGPFDTLKVAINGRGDGVVLADQPLDDLKLTISGTLSDAVPNLDIALDGVFIDQPLKLSARLGGDDGGALRLEDINGRYGPASIDGTLGLTPQGLPEGAVTFAVADLAELPETVLVGFGGSLNAHVTLSPLDGQANARIEIQARDLVGHDTRVKAIDARFEAEDFLNEVRISGTGHLKDPVVGGQQLGAVEFDVNASADGVHEVGLRDEAGHWAVKSTLELKAEDAVMALRIASFEGQLGGTAVKLARPTALLIGSGAVNLERTELLVGSGRLVVEGKLSPEMAVSVRVDRLPIAILGSVLPALAPAGTISGVADIHGDPSSPKATIALKGQGLSTAATREQGLTSLSFDIRGELDDQVLSLDGQVREQGSVLTVSGSIGFDAAGRIDLSINGELGAGLLARIGAQYDVLIKGKARLKIRVRGTAGNVAYAGTVITSGMTLSDAGGRFAVRGIEAELVLQDDIVRIARFSGTTAGGTGRVRVGGIISLAGDARSDLKIEIDKGRYSDGTLVVTLFDARLALRGSIAGRLALTGTVDLFNPKVTLNEPLPSTLEPLTVKHKSPPPQVRRQQPRLRRNANKGSPGNIDLDIEIRTVDPIAVTGRGINAQLGGRLRVTGPSSSPRASGAFRLRRGTVKLLSRKLDFNRGELDFTGSLTPQIRFSASARTDRAIITIDVTGRADAPNVTVSSVPDLPQEEALAVLIFGRSIGELSPLQVAQMAGSVAMLSGGSGGGLFDGLTDLIGSTNIETVRTETGSTAVSIGRQINDRLSVGIKQDIDTGKREVEIDLEITRQLKLRGSVGDDRSTSTGIFFEKEY